MILLATTVFAVSMHMDVPRAMSEKSDQGQLDQRISQAIMLINQGDFYKVLSIAKQLGVEFPEYAVVAILEGLAYEGLGQADQAIEAFELAIKRDPTESRAYARLGRIYYLMLKDTEKAKKYLYKSIELNSTDMDSHKILTYIYLDENDEQAAIEHIKKSIINTQNIDERIVIASYYLDRKEYQRAIDKCEIVLSSNPNSKEARNVMAQAYLLSGKTEKAIEILEGTLNQFPKDYTLYIALSQAYNSVGKKDELAKILNKAKLIEPENALSFFILGEYYLESEQFDKALYEFREAEQRDKTNTEIKSRIAMTYQMLNEPEKCIQICEMIRKSNGFVVQNEIMIAFNLRKLKKFSEAERTLKNVIDRDPHNLQALINLADLYNEQGKLDSAKENYKEIVALRQGGVIEHDAYYKLAAVHRMKNELVEAEILLKEGYERFPDSPIIPLSLANIQLALKNFDEAKKIYENGAEKYPEEPNYIYGLGITMLYLKEYDSAAEQFQKVIDLRPGHIDSISRLASISILKGDKDKAFELLRAKRVQYPENIDFIILLANFLENDGQKQEAENLYIQAYDIAPQNANVLFTLSSFYMAQGNNDKAIEYLSKVIEIDTTSPEPYFRLGMMYEQNGDEGKAIEVYRKGVAVNDTHPFMLNNLAWLVASHEKNYEEAMSYAGKANELMPGNGPIMDTLGWIIYLKGSNFKQAFELVKEAGEKAPNVASIQYHIGRMYMDMNKPDEAKNYLEKALQLAGEDPFPERQDVLDLLDQIK
jgi:tetratricopeptide (TPR) repeat protein